MKNNNENEIAQAKFENMAAKCAGLLTDLDGVMQNMRVVMIDAGATKHEVEQVHPAQWCQNVLTEYARKKLQSTPPSDSSPIIKLR